ncbi:universal stress protein [Escherichia albertii]|nr:universal stress protein [Escherichia albertii]
MIYKRIAVAGQDEDVLPVDKARALAEQNGAHLTIVHIDDIQEKIGHGIYMPSGHDVICGIRAHNREYIQELARDICKDKPKLIIRPGEMPFTLVEVVKEEQCDLLICGHNQSFIHKLLPSCRELINTLPINILIIPLPAEEMSSLSL